MTLGNRRAKAEAGERDCPANLPLRFIPPKSSSPAVQKQVSSRRSICLRAPPAHEAAGGYGFADASPPGRQSQPSPSCKHFTPRFHVFPRDYLKRRTLFPTVSGKNVGLIVMVAATSVHHDLFPVYGWQFIPLLVHQNLLLVYG